MGRKNYYKILGINVATDLKGVRHAYRSLAKKHHPDVTGEKNATPFRNIIEAYEVLSDPIKRDEYDKDLLMEQHQQRALRCKQKPLVHRRSQHRIRRAGVESFFSYSSLAKSFQLTSDVLELDLLLTREKAFHGGYFHVSVPAFVVCPVCRGMDMDEDWYPFCLHCRGQGRLQEQISLNISFPAHVRHGDILEVRIRMERSILLLRLHIQIKQ